MAKVHKQDPKNGKLTPCGRPYADWTRLSCTTDDNHATCLRCKRAGKESEVAK